MDYLWSPWRYHYVQKETKSSGCIFCGAAVVAGNLLERALLPQLYAGYQWSLLHGILKEGAAH